MPKIFADSHLTLYHVVYCEFSAGVVCGFFLSTLLCFGIKMRIVDTSQSIFEAYKHPFVLTYLGASLLVIYLPVSYLKDYIYEYYQNKLKSKTRNPNAHGIKLSPLEGSPMRQNGVYKASSLPGSPLRSNGVHTNSDVDLEKMVLEKEINSLTTDVESHPFLHKSSSLEDLKNSVMFTTWEIARIGMIMAPMWLLTEVGNVRNFNL